MFFVWIWITYVKMIPDQKVNVHVMHFDTNPNDQHL